MSNTAPDYVYKLERGFLKRFLFASFVRITFRTRRGLALFLVEIVLGVVGVLALLYLRPLLVLSIVVLGSVVVSLFVLPVIAMLGAARQIRASYRVGELMEARYDDSEFELRRSAGVLRRPYSSIAAVIATNRVVFFEGPGSTDITATFSELCPPDRVQWIRSKLRSG